MAKRELITCDRCGAELSMADIRWEWADFCARCKQAYERFMRGEDHVGDRIPVQVELPCQHHVPCAAPGCSGYAYELQKREERK